MTVNKLVFIIMTINTAQQLSQLTCAMINIRAWALVATKYL